MVGEVIVREVRLRPFHNEVARWARAAFDSPHARETHSAGLTAERLAAQHSRRLGARDDLDLR